MCVCACVHVCACHSSVCLTVRCDTLFQVFDTYPEHDLSTKKDFIKQTVKSVSTHTHTLFFLMVWGH